MNRDAPLFLRSIHPATIVFFALIALYAVLVQNGVLAPIEVAIRGWAGPRWLATLGSYLAVLLVVMLVYRLLTRAGRPHWLDILSINRGGLGLYDLLWLVMTAALVYLAWRYYGIVDSELLCLAVIAAVTALVGIVRRPPWRYIYIFQRSSNPAVVTLIPSMAALQAALSQEDEASWERMRPALLAANPGFQEAQQMPGQELFVPPGARGGPPAPERPLAPVEEQPGEVDLDTLPTP